VYVLYVDESGRSGLYDFDQPFFILGGLAFHDSEWKAIEADLIARVDALVPPPRPVGWELHMAHMFHGKGHFRGMPRSTRNALVDAVIEVFDQHTMTLLMMAVDKAAHVAKYAYPVSPARLAYEFMIERFNTYLNRRSDKVGMIVSDDQKGEEKTIRDAHESYRRQGTSQAKIDAVIETPFFVPSHRSWMIQIIDVATFWCNRALKDKRAGKPEPVPWTRLKAHLDEIGVPPRRVGLKIFPSP
jgi:hypothetical protein